MKKLTETINESFEIINEDKRDMVNIKKTTTNNVYGLKPKDFEFYLAMETQNIKDLSKLETVTNINNHKKVDSKDLPKGMLKGDEFEAYKVKRFGGSGTNSSPFCIMYVDMTTKTYYIFYARQTKEKILSDKKERSEKVTSAWLKKKVTELYKDGKLEKKTKYYYTDDYALDNARNFGKTDWSLVDSDSELKGIIRDLDSKSYSVRDKKGDPEWGVFSSWESYLLREKEQKGA